MTARRGPLRIVLAAIVVAAIGMAAIGVRAGFLDRDPIHLYGVVQDRPVHIAAVYLSGDMGLRFGMGKRVAPALAARGIPVYGINAPTLFTIRRTQADVDALVAGAVRDALVRAHADRVVLMGQSFGSDILVAGIGALPVALRKKVAAIVLVVPGRTIYFRADPTGLAYRGTPDVIGETRMRTLDWAPLICIYGQSEPDSLCPALQRPGATIIALPGGHFLNNDPARLIATILPALDAVLPRD